MRRDGLPSGGRAGAAAKRQPVFGQFGPELFIGLDNHAPIIHARALACACRPISARRAGLSASAMKAFAAASMSIAVDCAAPAR